tara:strand:+ start:2341 stop:2916 length:576 start_codon:yes stop_codon:yes gene_type:complete
MLNSKVFIINNKVLYDVLTELKNQYIFNIIYFENKEDFLISLKNEKYEDFIIIDKKSFGKEIDINRFLIIKNYPIKLIELIQNINIKILQSSFNFKSSISINKYIINLNSRNLIKEKKSLKLTEKEINLLLYLKKANEPQKVNKLQENVWYYVNDLETHTVETHIYRLRKKIKETFNDDKLIQTSKEGYFV